MKQSLISTTHVVMGAITIAAGFFLGLTLVGPFIYILPYYRGDLPQILMVMSAGLGLGCACGMIPTGYGLILRKGWASQTLQICVLLWAFAAGFALLDSGLFGLRPLHLAVIVEGIWPVIVLFWIKTRETLIVETGSQEVKNVDDATQPLETQKPLPRSRDRR